MNTRAITKNKKVVTFGEVMLRLTTPNFQRFSQTNELIATYGGSEANVAISLVNFGIPTEFVTRLPENAMAQACVNSLQAYGLGTDGIIYGGKRMGLYFLESGAAFRNSNVVYDREGSSCDRDAAIPDQWNQPASERIFSQSIMPGRKVAKEDPSRSYTTLELRNAAPLSRKYNPMRFPP